MDERKRRGPRLWSEAERDSVLDTMPTIKGRYSTGRGEVRKSDWWLACLRLSFGSGLSYGYLSRIGLGDITPNGCLVVALRNPERRITFDLPEETRSAIRRLGNRKLPLRLAEPQYRIRTDWRRALGAAGLPRDIHPFDTRGWEHPDAVTMPEPSEVEDSTMPLRAFFHEFYLPLKLAGRSARTAVLYDYSIRSFGRFLQREPLLTDLENDTVTKYLSWLRSEGRADHTVEKERCQLLAIWRFGCQRRLVREFPTIQKGRMPKRAPLAWTLDDLERLFVAVDSLNGSLGKIPRSAWWRALLLLLFDTGERIHAAMLLTWDTVDLDGGWVRFPAEIRKGQTQDNLLKLHPATVEAIAKLPRGGVVFPWPLAETYLWNQLGDLLKAAGLPADSRSKFHRMRRTTASYYEQQGHNATELLGHTSRVVTRRYLDSRIIDRAHPADVLPRSAAMQLRGVTA